MAQVERQMALPEDAVAQLPKPGEPVALMDSLRGGTLNETRAETVRVLRTGLVALAE